MNVHIEEIVASVTAMDSDAILSPAVLATIVRAVLAAQADLDVHRVRQEAERNIGCSIRTSGVPR